MKNKKNVDILFLDGLIPRISKYPSFVGFIFPIGAVLKKHKYSFKIFNLSLLDNFSIQGMLDELKKINFSTIGISTHAENIRWVYKVVESIKSEYPKVPIILGGPQVTFSAVKTLQRCPCDIIVRHEGENTLINLLNYFLKNEGSLSIIDGITYRNGQRIVTNKDARLIDLNTLPRPLYEVFNDERYWYIPSDTSKSRFRDFLKHIRSSNNAFLTSRGCPYLCVFCVEGSLRNKHRERNIKNIISDLEHYIKNIGTKFIVFGDDTFTSSKRRVIDMCEIIKKLRCKYDFVWFAEGRVNILAKDPDLIETMVDAGLVSLQVGIESGSQEVLDAQNKRITLDQLRKVAEEIGFLKDRNVSLAGNFIFGGPGETKHTMEETISFAKELLKLANFNIELKHSFLVPFEGTPIRNSPDSFEMTIIDEDFETKMLQFTEILCHPKYLSKNDLINGYFSFNYEINSYVRNNMFKLPKEEIDKKVLHDKDFSRKYIPPILSSWVKTYYSLYLFHRYYELFEQDSTIKNINLDNVMNSCPLRIWEINFDLEKNAYIYQTFDGRMILIEKEFKILWEMADGKRTFLNILHDENNPLKNNPEGPLVIYNFYTFMYYNFSLIFREY